MSGIYCIKNLANGKMYIGSTTNFAKRQGAHFRALRKGRHHSIKLQRAYEKYGPDSFEFQVLEEVSSPVKGILAAKETVWMAAFDTIANGYNVSTAYFGDCITGHPDKKEIIARRTETIRENMAKLTPKERKARYGSPGEKNPMYGRTHNEAARKKISETHKGNSYRKGKKASEESKRKLSEIASRRVGEKNGMYGKTHTDETKEKISKANQGRPPPNKKLVSVDGNIYNGLYEASEALEVPVTTIRWRCLSTNPRFSAYFYIDKAQSL